MNNMDISAQKSKSKTLKLNGRTKDVLLIAVLAFVILFAAWRLFYLDDTAQDSNVDVYSDTEKRISEMLRQMDGVGDANVIVCETEEGVQSVVVICDGAKDLQVIMHIREAVAAAVGTQEKDIKIYLKKE